MDGGRFVWTTPRHDAHLRFGRAGFASFISITMPPMTRPIGTLPNEGRRGRGHSHTAIATRAIFAALLSFGTLTATLGAEIPESFGHGQKQTPGNPQREASEKVASSAPKPGTDASPALRNLPSGGYVLLPSGEISRLASADKKKETIADTVLAFIKASVPLISVLVWPLVTLVAVIRILRAPEVKVFLDRLSGRVTQLSVAGLEIQLSADAKVTLADLQKLFAQLPETHKEWVANSHLTIQFQLVVSEIKMYLTTFANVGGAPLGAADFARFRFTLHVPDVLVEHSLRQLVDYLGNDRGKSGRLFSARRGIIGKAWRLQRGQYVSRSYTEEQLIELWGMTRSEANDTTGGRTVYLAVFIKSDQGLPLAIFYADSDNYAFFDGTRTGALTESDVFNQFEAKVIQFSKDKGLTKSLEMLEEARIKVPRLDPYEPKLS